MKITKSDLFIRRRLCAEYYQHNPCPKCSLVVGIKYRATRTADERRLIETKKRDEKYQVRFDVCDLEELMGAFQVQMKATTFRQA